MLRPRLVRSFSKVLLIHFSKRETKSSKEYEGEMESATQVDGQIETVAESRTVSFSPAVMRLLSEIPPPDASIYISPPQN